MQDIIEMRFFTYKCEIPFSSKVKSGIVCHWTGFNNAICSLTPNLPEPWKESRSLYKKQNWMFGSLKVKIRPEYWKVFKSCQKHRKNRLKKKNQKVLFFRLGRNFLLLQFAPWNIYFTLIITLVHNTFVEIKTFQSKITDLTSNHAVTNIVSKYYLLSNSRRFF